MKMYAVVAEGYEDTAAVKLMCDSDYGAINLWERRNPEANFEIEKDNGWIVREYDVQLI